MVRRFSYALLLLIPLMTNANPVVLYQDRATVVQKTLPDPLDLWVEASELPAVNDFELKEEGACLDDICVPIRQDQDSELFVTRQSTGWVNVTELARKLNQPYAVYRDPVDRDASVWSLGPIPATRQRLVNEHVAPDFALVDADGEEVRLSQFRDMKVLLLTWASW